MVNEDQDNDFVHAIDSTKRRIVEPAVQQFSAPQRLQREQKKRDNVHDKKLKSDERLKKQENKLKDKHDSYKQRKRKPKPQNKQAKKTVTDESTEGEQVTAQPNATNPNNIYLAVGLIALVGVGAGGYFVMKKKGGKSAVKETVDDDDEDDITFPDDEDY